MGRFGTHPWLVVYLFLVLLTGVVALGTWVSIGALRPRLRVVLTNLDAGRRAMFGLSNRLDENRVWAPAVRLQAFDTQVRSVLCYGAEVWGPDRIVSVLRLGKGVLPAGKSYFDLALEDGMVQVQRDFCLRCAGLKQVPYKLLYRELSQLPLQYFWLRLALCFWNKIVKSRGSVYHDVLVDDLRLALLSDLKVDCWSSKVLIILRWLGHEWPACDSVSQKVDVYSSQLIRVGEVLERLSAFLLSDWDQFSQGGDPRVFQGKGVSLCRYHNWMGSPSPAREGSDPTGYLRVYLPVNQLRMVAKFRLCCWPLEVNKGHHRPRECRTCQVCTSGKVEDEYHVLMECEAYTELRNRFLINVEDTDMRKVFLNTNPRKIATFLTEVFDERQQRALEPHGS